MKKKLFLGLLAAAAVSFTACQKDEVISEMPQDNAIGFGTYVGRDAQTKASEATINTMMADENGFGVFAYYTESSNYANTYKPEFMNNEQVCYDGGWTYTNIKYWPGNNSNHKVSFFAYAPYTDVTTSTLETNITALGTTGINGIGDPTLTFKVASTVSEQVDLLYAEPVKDRWKGDFEEDDSPYDDQTIKFTFNHALSRIGFKAKTARDDFKVTINEIQVSGKFNTTGVLNLATVDTENGRWTTLNRPTENNGISSYRVNSFLDIAEDFTNTEAQPISKSDGYLMVLPTASTENITVTVTVNYDYTYYGTTVTGREQSGTISDLTLAKGKAYTFVLTLNPTNDLTPISFDVEVNPWDPTDPTDDSNDVPVVTVQ